MYFLLPAGGVEAHGDIQIHSAAIRTGVIYLIGPFEPQTLLRVTAAANIISGVK